MRVGRQRIDRGPAVRPAAATHDHLALAFCVGGTARVHQGVAWSFGEGEVMLIPAGSPHHLVEATGADQWFVGVHPASLAAGGDAALLEPFDRVRAGGAAVLAIPPARRAFLATLFAELEAEVARAGGGTLAAQRSLLTLIFTEVARGVAVATDAVDDSVVAEALRFIERRCLDPISLRDVAAAVRRSPAHVTTLVRRATGRPVQAWIIAGRLAEAARRLRHTDERVDVIAERVGYADATHFIRLFRRANGVTPQAWRALQRG